MESVVSDQPGRTAQADPKRQFTQLSECPFSRFTIHLISRLVLQECIKALKPLV